jgi:hypothetical protein
MFDQFIRAARRDGAHQTIADPITFLGDDVADCLHRPFVILA